MRRRVYVVRDAMGHPESKETTVRRMGRHGAEIVTMETLVFEWLGDTAHPRFCETMAFVK